MDFIIKKTTSPPFIPTNVSEKIPSFCHPIFIHCRWSNDIGIEAYFNSPYLWMKYIVKDFGEEKARLCKGYKMLCCRFEQLIT